MIPDTHLCNLHQVYVTPIGRDLFSFCFAMMHSLLTKPDLYPCILQIGEGKETVLMCVQLHTGTSKQELHAHCESEKKRLDAKIALCEQAASKQHPIWKRKTIINVLPNTVQMCFYDMLSEANIKKLFCAEWDFDPEAEEEYDTDEFSSIYGNTRANKELGKNLLKFTN
jgi:hypothetical protein